MKQDIEVTVYNQATCDFVIVAVDQVLKHDVKTIVMARFGKN